MPMTWLGVADWRSAPSGSGSSPGAVNSLSAARMKVSFGRKQALPTLTFLGFEGFGLTCGLTR